MNHKISSDLLIRKQLNFDHRFKKTNLYHKSNSKYNDQLSIFWNAELKNEL